MLPPCAAGAVECAGVGAGFAAGAALTSGNSRKAARSKMQMESKPPLRVRAAGRAIQRTLPLSYLGGRRFCLRAAGRCGVGRYCDPPCPHVKSPGEVRRARMRHVLHLLFQTSAQARAPTPRNMQQHGRRAPPPAGAWIMTLGAARAGHVGSGRWRSSKHDGFSQLHTTRLTHPDHSESE